MIGATDRILRWLVLALCLSTGGALTAGDEPQLDCNEKYFDVSSLCALPDDLCQFYSPLAEADQATLEDLLGAMAADRQSRQFRFHEFVSILRSLRKIVDDVADVDVAVQDEELTWIERRDDVAIVWVNPICSSCQTAVMRFDELRKSAPEIVFRLVPTRDLVSLYATASLELIRLVDPDLYGPATRRFLDRLPSTHGAVTDEFRSLMATEKKPEDYQEYETAKAIAERAAQAYPASLGTPHVLYRHRVIRANKSGGLVFDPFRHANDLALTIKLIRLEEVVHEKATSASTEGVRDDAVPRDDYY